MMKRKMRRAFSLHDLEPIEEETNEESLSVVSADDQPIIGNIRIRKLSH